MLTRNKTRCNTWLKVGLMGVLIGLFFALSIGSPSSRDAASESALTTTTWGVGEARYSPSEQGGFFDFSPLSLQGSPAFSAQLRQVEDQALIALAYRLTTLDGSLSDWVPLAPLDTEDRPDFVAEDRHTVNYQLQLVGQQGAVQFRLTHQGLTPNTPPSLAITRYGEFAEPEQNVAHAAVSPSSITSRAAWNPGNSICPMNWTPINYAVNKIVIHHTADGRQNSITTYNQAKAAVQATCNYHSRSLGWGDIGYNYLIAPTGHIFEGRAGGEGVEAGHAYAANKGSIGIAMIGTYSDQGISAAARSSLVALLADLSQRHQIDPTGTQDTLKQGCYSFATPNIAGHREYKVIPRKNASCTQCSWADYNEQKQSSVPGCPDLKKNATTVISNATQCPGNSLYPALSSIRSAVAAKSILTPRNGEFVAEYYSNQSLSGLPVSVRLDGAAGKVSHDWGLEEPLAGVPRDRFSVRWRGTLAVPADAIYTLSVGSDDGTRVYIDNTFVINNWVDQSYSIKTGAVGLAKGNHQVRLEYYENQGAAKVTFSAAKKTVPVGRFVGRYYTNAVFAGPPIVREDKAIDFNWKTGSPDARIPSDFFSVVWTGTIDMTEADDFLFTLTADDKVKLFVDDMKKPLINEWQDQATTFTAAKTLSKGKHEVRLEYAESRVGALVKLSYEPTQGTVEYFPNTTLTGSPKKIAAIGDIGTLDLNWGRNSPISGIPADRFSARFKGEIEVPESTTYKLSLGSDDGSRLYVNDKLVQGAFDDHSYLVRDTYLYLKKGTHKIRIDYYENGEDARVSFAWKKEPVPVGQFLAKYYTNNKASGTPLFSRIDKAINFDWKTGSPDGHIPRDNFSVVWEGTIIIPKKEKYLFTLFGDDKVTLYVDDMKKPLINEWEDQATTFTATKTLDKGNHKIRLRYAESYGDAKVKLHYGTIGGTAEYFNNKDLKGTPKTVPLSDIGKLDLNWGLDSPLQGIPADGFSARFTGEIDAPSDGSYALSLGSDDGSRVYVNNKLVQDAFNDHSYRARTVYLTLKKGKHPIRIDYYENGGDARVAFSWKKISLPVNQFIGRYYANSDMKGVPLFSRIDKKINFNWKTGSPDSEIAKDHFSVIWDGTIDIPSEEDYVFSLFADDKVVLYVGDMKQPLISEWQDQSTTFSATKSLAAGKHKVRLKYAESMGIAKVNLSWKTVNSLEFSSAGGITATQEDGKSLLKIPKNTVLKISYNAGTQKYYLAAENLTADSSLPVVLTATTGSPKLVTYENFGYSPHNKYKTFRGSLVIKEQNGLNIINRIAIEDYLKGLGETGLKSDPEYTKALIVAARTYALYNLQIGGKHAANGFTLNNTASDQVYYGYAYEQLGGKDSVLSRAVEATTGKVITHPKSPHENHLIIASYFSQTDAVGRTCGQSDPANNTRCTWGSIDSNGNNVVAWPWIPTTGAVDPWWMKEGICYKADNNGRSGSGHGYGMSGRGAYCYATQENKDMAWILNHYYAGINAFSSDQSTYPLDTTKLTIDIGIETVTP